MRNGCKYLKIREACRRFRNALQSQKRLWLLVVFMQLVALLEYVPEGAFLLSIDLNWGEFLHNFAGLAWMSCPFYLGICAPVCFLPPRPLRIYLAILLPWVLSITALHMLLFAMFHIALGKGVFYVLLDTGLREIQEYLGSTLSVGKFLAGVGGVAGIVGITIWLVRWKWELESRRVGLGILLLCPLLLSGGRFLWQGNAEAMVSRVAVLRSIYEFASALTGQDKLYHAAVVNPQFPGRIGSVFPERQDFLGVIVIGESANRNHHSLYGYTRKTTPFQEARRGQMLCFDQVFASAPLTGVSLTQAFTFATLFQPEDYRCTLVGILKRAGIHVVWLSAQQERCSTDALLFAGADDVAYVPDGERDDQLVAMLDEVLAKYRQEPTVVFLHLLGSHNNYDLRYPESFRVFRDVPPDAATRSMEEQETINHYDNSILFTDRQLENVMETLEQSGRPSFLLYFSDHGEDASKHRRQMRRGPGSSAPCFYEIPFWVWLSDDYRNMRAAWSQTAAQNRQKPMQLDRGFLYACCDLAGIQFEEFSWKSDIFSADFEGQSIFLMTTEHPYTN